MKPKKKPKDLSIPPKFVLCMRLAKVLFMNERSIIITTNTEIYADIAEKVPLAPKSSANFGSTYGNMYFVKKAVETHATIDIDSCKKPPLYANTDDKMTTAINIKSINVNNFNLLFFLV